MAKCSVHFKPEDFQPLFASLPAQSTPYIPRRNRDDFGVTAFHPVGKVIEPPVGVQQEKGEMI